MEGDLGKPLLQFSVQNPRSLELLAQVTGLCVQIKGNSAHAP